MVRTRDQWFQRLFGSGVLFRQISTTLSGTIAAQVLTVATMAPLARLYGPADLGLFAIMQSVVAVGVTLAALRYDMAIVLPKSDVVALVLYRIASRSTLVSSGILSVVLVAAHPLISRTYSSVEFATWMVVSGLAVYLTAQVMNVQFWLTRRMEYAAIARNRLVQAAAVAAFQALFAFVAGGFQGLLAGLVAGQALTLLMVYRRAPALRERIPADAPSSWQVAKRFGKMPLVNGPTAVLDAIRLGGISVLIGNIAVTGLGQFSLAFTITKAPVSLINGAIAQVMLQRLAATAPGSMMRMLGALFARISLFSVPVFVLFYLVAPYLFPLVFGDGWDQAGLIARALVPWLFMVTFTSPLASVFVVTSRQEWALAFAVLSTVVTLGFLAVSPLEMLPTVTWLGWIMAGLLVLWVVMALVVARDHDRSRIGEKVG